MPKSGAGIAERRRISKLILAYEAEEHRKWLIELDADMAQRRSNNKFIRTERIRNLLRDQFSRAYEAIELHRWQMELD